MNVQSHLYLHILLLFSNPIFNLCPVLITTTNNLPNVIVLHAHTQYNDNNIYNINPQLWAIECIYNKLKCITVRQKMYPYHVVFCMHCVHMCICICSCKRDRKRIKCALLHILLPKGLFPLCTLHTHCMVSLEVCREWWCDACSFIDFISVIMVSNRKALKRRQYFR